MLIEKTDLIQKIAICGGLKTETLRFVLQQSQEIERVSGEFFFREGDAGDCLYVLKSGTALVQRSWQGREIVLARIRPGDCFGEMSLIDLQRRFAAVTAETDCTAIRVPYSAICKLVQFDMEQYTMVMMNLGREVSRRLRVAGNRLFHYQQEFGHQWFDEELTGDV
ncbi:Crp/Fnr family transcriptional regulator [Stieleria tagensis]|uniref:Crp/Fnr family transcriptional regulator n=1 Tax=Stieleria tagensis TaxID=2956795 RepID=UPI00209A8AEC|nr:cyclic nucleotide-binding domain-containing protein [Stieleria tagensis]